jgi:hypothetical protein
MDKPRCPHCGKAAGFSQHSLAWMVRPIVSASEANGITTSGFREQPAGEPVYLTDCCIRRVSPEQIIEAFAGVEYDPFECVR